ncbi:kinase domain protein (macronuclear) [Tetrahymena thermophila SB210]|uniref:Kinase domain protein n=1 Tax=Tetrahymena thermophila (strain SB210) TaxID=312017 RepID=Q239K0_TETTS|nr:kinase domain protein [Tetrahymena thermophila SB210]EAR93190.2 kinase domain protein [Tetrahymena thermophila SB210]|eukprot:XP_001013435.2 kinase domain protein [Tetrahymena thermophila SB210]
MKLFSSVATVILFNIIQISITQSLQQFSSIYSSTYSNKIDTLDRINQIQFIEVTSKKGFVFATAEAEGLIILDSNNNNKLIFQGKLSGPLYQAIAVTSDGQHVFLSINNTFCAYQFLYSDNSYGLYQYYQNQTDVSQIQRIQILENENRVIIAHFSGLLTLVDISNRDNLIISILANYTVQSTLRGLKITKDMLWIIISDYNYGLMVFYWQDQTNAQKTLNLINVAISSSVSPSYFVITQDGRYVMIVEYWDGFSIIDLYPIQQKYIQNQFTNFTIDTPSLVVRRWWVDNDSSPDSLAITMTNDENYVMIGQRSVGIYIIDISNKLNPQLFQIISASLDSLCLILSKDSQQQYLYYSNGNSLLAFKKSEPNLNLDVPNILNVQKSTSINAGNSKWRWTGAVEINNQFLFQSSQDQGLAIMDLRVSPQLMTPAYQIPVNISEGSVDSFFLFGKNQIYLAVPIQTLATMMNIYNITDRKNPILIQSLPSNDPSYSYSMDMSDDETLFVFDNNFSFVLFNSTTIGKFIQISQWQFQNGVFGGIANGLIISHDSNFIVAVERASVICVVDISNKKNPQLANYFRTNGGENIIKAKYGTNKQYAFIVQGLYGIDVIDMTSLPQLNIVSRVQVQGYSNFISLIQNNTYALVSQLDIGEISLVNYTDITQPKIVSTFQYVNEHAASVCASPIEDYFYIISQSGLRTVPLKSNTYIHTEIQQVLNANTGSPQLIHLSKYQPLLVGQQINYQFQILLPTPGIQITNVYYIEYGQLQSLPYWMNYNPIQQTLSLNIVKDSLGQNYDTSKRNQLIQNTIVVQSNIPVIASDLVFTKAVHGVDQSLDQANQILNYFHNIGLLDKSDFVTSVFQYQKPLGINLNGINFSDQLLSNIKLVLQNSVTLNPIYFNTQSSLNINLNPPQSQGSQLSYISALESRVYMFLTIDLQYGMFVNKNYNGLISSTTSARNQVQLEGDPQVLNACLNNKIEVFIHGIQNVNSTSKIQELLQLVNVTVQLQDNTNYDIIQNFTIIQASFFRFRDRLVLNPNPNMNLQDQVNSQFSNGNLEIKTSISIEFSQNSFIIVDSQTDHSLPLTYNAYLIKNGQYISIPSNFWLQFQPSLLKFTGQCSYSEFNNKYCFFLNVTDQYSVASDIFCVVTNQIPFLIILNLVFQILGPIVFVLGLYKYQDIIYNWIFAQKNLYSTEYAKINHTFYHRTIFIGQNMQIANEIFTKFINEFNQGRITVNQSPQPEDQTNIYDTQIQGKSKEMAKKNISQELNLSRDLKKKITDLTKTPNQKLTKIEQTYLSQKDSSLLFEKFIADLLNSDISFRLDGKIQFVTSYKEQLKSKSNLLRLSIRSLLARHLLEKDKMTAKAYNFLKQYSKDQKKYTKNDWYKHYVHINHMEEDDEDNNEANLSILPIAHIAASPSNLNQNFNNNININQQNKYFYCNIPQLSIKKESFDLALNTFNIEEGEENTAQEANQQEIPVRYIKTSIKVIQKQTKSKIFQMINRHLLKEILFADTLGLVNPSPSRYRPCSGESIHLEEHEIASVRAFTKANKSYLSGLRRIFKLEYVPLASYENRKLPQWLDYTSKQDLFLLKGCPTIEDQSEILLRFYNQKQFILKQFLIKIEYKTEDTQLNRILNSNQHDLQNQLRFGHSKQSNNNQDQNSLLNTPIQLKSILNSNSNFFKGKQKSTFQSTAFNQNQNILGESQSNADDEIISMEGEDIQENSLKESNLKQNYQIQSQEIIHGQKNAPTTNQEQQLEFQDNKINKYSFDVLNIKQNSQNEEQNE